MTVRNLEITLEPADPLGGDALQLLQDMRAEALRRYGDVIVASAPPPTNALLVPRSTFLIARLGRQPVGCAALRPITVDVAEVRRMYVVHSMRRHGIGRLLVTALEQMASGFGYRAIRLETGIRQPEASALYASQGFHRIPPYGDYVSDPLSICFEKDLLT